MRRVGGEGEEGWRGSDVTTEIKSNANTKLHYPSRTLADPSSLPSCSHSTRVPRLPPSPQCTRHPVRFSRFFHRPSVSLRRPSLSPAPPLSPFPRSPAPCPLRHSARVRDPSLYPSSLARLLFPPPCESPHRSHPPPGNNPLADGSLLWW